MFGREEAWLGHRLQPGIRPRPRSPASATARGPRRVWTPVREAGKSLSGSHGVCLAGSRPLALAAVARLGNEHVLAF